MNKTNSGEAFSWHPGGMNVTRVDGSTAYVSEDVDLRVFAALITRAGGEIAR